jgi:uncharacterized damage-inducible protein DinB
MDHLSRLTRYKEWANGLLFAEVAKLPAAVLVAPQNIVFGNLLRTLHHVLAMDFVWQCHLLGRPHGLTTRNPDHCPSFEEIRSAQQAMDRWYIDYADALTHLNRGQRVEFTFIGGAASSMTREDIVLHVVNHGTYHRGHVANMLRDAAVPAPITDYPVYLKSVSAA